MFIEQPDVQGIIDAIEIDIEELDEQDVDEFEQMQEFRECAMEVLKHAGPDLFGDVRIADVYLGSITLSLVACFRNL